MPKNTSILLFFKLNMNFIEKTLYNKSQQLPKYINKYKGDAKMQHLKIILVFSSY
jgi:hypothetical protein